MKSYKMQLPVLLLLILHQFLYQQISFFTTFYNFILHYLKKIFVASFSFLTDLPRPPLSHSVKCDKRFLSIFLQMPFETYIF